ncbi:MAG: AAA-like domain-containing protein [Oscillospiraceae bacterium]|nr:AAA-like domain-containing protein [Oscillospiraceae bacterium]
MKRFNVTGICVPDENYMVDISEKIAQIKKLIDNRCYFTINRARQYGKTTTLYEIRRRLSKEYLIVKISFEGLGEDCFESDGNFCAAFMELIQEALELMDIEANYAEKWLNCEALTFKTLGKHITNMCRDKKIVLMIDEVDKTSNNRVFLQFLSMLRQKYLARAGGDDYTFHSVILAGVYDVKTLKLKMINEGSYTPSESENKLYNSPWNIAVNFTVDMSFSPAEIATMLNEYETDHGTGMDIAEISEEIHAYTGGYPFLVSRLCQCIDEELGQNWSAEGLQGAADILLYEKNTLFDDIYKNLSNNKELYQLLYDILICGDSFGFKLGNPVIDLANMYGIIANKNGLVAVSNRIFETIIYDYFISINETSLKSQTIKGVISDVVRNGRLDMEQCLCKFADHYAEMFTERDASFLERHGRLLFLTYLRPFINGSGYYHIESETRNQQRMDIVVDYGREQFIIELKLWKGKQYQKMCNECERSSHTVHTNRLAYKQLLDYMKIKKADKGYLLTFDFRKEKNKGSKAEWMELDGKKIFDVIV